MFDIIFAPCLLRSCPATLASAGQRCPEVKSAPAKGAHLDHGSTDACRYGCECVCATLQLEKIALFVHYRALSFISPAHTWM